MSVNRTPLFPKIFMKELTKIDFFFFFLSDISRMRWIIECTCLEGSFGVENRANRIEYHWYGFPNTSIIISYSVENISVRYLPSTFYVRAVRKKNKISPYYCTVWSTLPGVHFQYIYFFSSLFSYCPPSGALAILSSIILKALPGEKIPDGVPLNR